MSIEPDTKDWTWVLERRCPQCGEDAQRIQPGQVAMLVRDCADQWEKTLTGSAAAVRRRPGPQVWSALEYGCHVRDVFALFDRRLASMLAEDNPTFPSWDQNTAAAEQGYGEQHPQQVATALVAAASTVANRFEQVPPTQWLRTGTRGDGFQFTVITLARYLLHDVVHHLHDVRFPPAPPAR